MTTLETQHYFYMEATNLDDPMELGGDGERHGTQDEDVDIDLTGLEYEGVEQEDEHMGDDIPTTAYYEGEDLQDGNYNDDQMGDENFQEDIALDETPLDGEVIDYEQPENIEDQSLASAYDLAGEQPLTVEGISNIPTAITAHDSASVVSAVVTQGPQTKEALPDSAASQEPAVGQQTYDDRYQGDLEEVPGPATTESQVENIVAAEESALRASVEFSEEVPDGTKAVKSSHDLAEHSTNDEVNEENDVLALPETVDAEMSLEHPVVVTYSGEEMSLFPPAHNEQEHSETFLLQDKHLAGKSIDKILEACRAVLADSIGEQDELNLDVDDLGLHISEVRRFPFL